MLEDMADPTPDELLIEGISSPIAAQLLDFCDDDDCAGAGDLFSGSDHSSLLLPPYEEAATSSSSAATTAVAAASSPLCCYAVDDVDAAPFSPFPSSLCTLLDAAPPPPPPLAVDPEAEPDLAHYPSSSSSSSAPPPPPPAPEAAMFPVPPAPYVGDPFDQIVITEAISNRYPLDLVALPPPAGGPPGPQQQQNRHATQYEELVGLEAHGGFLDGVGMSSALYGGGGETQGLFGGGMSGGLLGDVAERGGLGAFAQDAMPRAYSSGEMQAIGGGIQHLIAAGSCSSGAARPAPTPDISTSDEPNYKVGRLSPEERKEKIERYLRKRNVRNFSKKIKYACRKTLADSRPRVRGRFAKNDELGEGMRLQRSSSNEFDDDEEVSVKEEDIVDSSDILAHIGGANQFKYNFAALESDMIISWR